VDIAGTALGGSCRAPGCERLRPKNCEHLEHFRRAYTCTTQSTSCATVTEEMALSMFSMPSQLLSVGIVWLRFGRWCERLQRMSSRPSPSSFVLRHIELSFDIKNGPRTKRPHVTLSVSSYQSSTSLTLPPWTRLAVEGTRRSIGSPAWCQQLPVNAKAVLALRGELVQRFGQIEIARMGVAAIGHPARSSGRETNSHAGNRRVP